MPTLREITEAGETVIGRTITGVLAALFTFGLVKVLSAGSRDPFVLVPLFGGAALFGGFTILGPRWNQWLNRFLP